MNVVVTGHVDHGKSTLIGRLLYDSKQITEGRISEVQKLAQEYKKKFEFAYFIDSYRDELKEERTIDTTQVRFKGKERIYTIIDTPGHKEFVKNMLTGASRADAAILVVSVTDGAQEQTKRHLFLLDLLGIRNLIVFVNKMDLVSYDIKKFLDIEVQVSKLIKEYNFESIRYIQGSALEGLNVYKEGVVDALDSLIIREWEKPMRFLVQDTYRNIIVGKVISGTLKEEDILGFQPSGLWGQVSSLLTYKANLKEAGEGTSIGLVMDTYPKRGDVGMLKQDWIKAKEEYDVEFVLIDGKVEVGTPLQLKCGTKIVNCEIKKIKSKVDSETGEILQEVSPKKVKENEAAIAIIGSDPIVVEPFSKIPELGRFTLSKNKKIIGMGVVL